MKSQLESRRQRREAIEALMTVYSYDNCHDSRVFLELVRKGLLKMLLNLDPMERALLFSQVSPLRQRQLRKLLPDAFETILN